MRQVLLVTLFACLLAVALAGYCTKQEACGRTCTGWWNRRCRDKYCQERVCCPGYCGDDCGTLCSRLCKRTETCDKKCSKRSCTRHWWRTRCRDIYYTCTGTCSFEECCSGWKGPHCDEPDKVLFK